MESFSGFERPEDNFNRAPNSWFEVWAWVRARLDAEMSAAAAARGEERLENDTASDRITGLLKCMIYIVKHTFGVQNYTTPLRLSASDIRNGRPKYRGAAPDQGVGLNPKTIASALERLHELGLITLSIDSSDPARVTKRVLPRIAPGKGGGLFNAAQISFSGFDDPRANYWIQPDVFTDLIRPLKKATTILGVQYLFRHSWSWYGPDGFRDMWVGMSADEIANGKYLRNADGSFARDGQGNLMRLDNGIGYTTRNVHTGMAEAVAQGLVVYRSRINPLSLLEEREYLLRRHGWPSGEWQTLPASQTTPDTVSGSAPNLSRNEARDVITRGRDVITRGEDVFTRGRDDDTRGQEGAPRDVITRGGDDDTRGADVFDRGADVNPSRTYKPTTSTQTIDPPATPSTKARERTAQHNGVVGGTGAAFSGFGFPNPVWTETTKASFLACVDLLRYVGFSRQTAQRLAEPWTNEYASEAGEFLVHWLYYHETVPGLDPERRTGFIRVKLEAREEPPQTFQSPVDFWARRFVKDRLAAYFEEGFERPLVQPVDWWDAQERKAAEKSAARDAQQAQETLQRTQAENVRLERERDARAQAEAERRAERQREEERVRIAQQTARLGKLREKYCVPPCAADLEFLEFWDSLSQTRLGATWPLKLTEVSPERCGVCFDKPVTALALARFLCEVKPGVDAALTQAGFQPTTLTLPGDVDEGELERWLSYRETVDEYAAQASAQGRVDSLTRAGLRAMWPLSFDAGVLRLKSRDVAKKDMARVAADLAQALTPVFGVPARVEWVV